MYLRTLSLAGLAVATVVWGQSPAALDVPYQVRYAVNLTSQAGGAAGLDAYFSVANDGANGASAFGAGGAGNLCANLYVFDNQEEMLWCCSCTITPDETIVFSLQNDILGNPLTKIATGSVTVKLVATAPSGGNCSQSAAFLGTERTVDGMLAWGTSPHMINQAGQTVYFEGETPFLPATLSTAEEASLANRCAFIVGNGSGSGQCASCPPIPLTLVVPPTQNLYVSSSFNSEVLEYNGSTGAFLSTFVTSGSGGLNNPFGLTFGPDGNLYVAGIFNNQVLQYNGTTGAFMSVFASGGSLSLPYALTFGPDGNLYVGSLNSNQVLEYNGGTGAFLSAFVTASSGGLAGPAGLTFGPDGNLYVASANNNEVLKYNGGTGAFTSVFVTAGSGGLNNPLGLTFGPDGNLYVASASNSEVLKYNGSTGAFISIFVTAGSGGLSSPLGLTFGPNGNLYVASESTSKVLEYNGSTGAFMSVFASGGGLNNPTFLVFH